MRRLLNLPLPTGKRLLTVMFDSEEGPVYVHIPEGLLSPLEEGKVIQLGGKYWGRLDEPHVPGDQEHLHLYAKGKGQPLMAVNVDGSLRHKGSMDRIPNKAAKAMRQHLKHFTIPDNNIPEWLAEEDLSRLLFD